MGLTVSSPHVSPRAFQQGGTTGYAEEMEKEIYQEGLGHMVTEAEKSYDFFRLLSASWSPRKVGGVARIQAQRPGNPRSQWYKFKSELEGLEDQKPSCPRTGEDRCLSSRRERADSHWTMPFHSDEADLLCSIY